MKASLWDEKLQELLALNSANRSGIVVVSDGRKAVWSRRCRQWTRPSKERQICKFRRSGDPLAGVRPSGIRLMSINLDVARHLRPHPSSTKGADEIGDLAALGRFV
jgi:hypothetical protein